MNCKNISKFFSSSMFGKTTYLVAARRTPIGSFMGQLSKAKAPELGTIILFLYTCLGGIAIQAALSDINLDPSEVNEIIMGNVCQAGVGQNPARQAALLGGIPTDKTCTTINKVCASGMKTVMYGAQSIGLGQSDVVIAGGFESMSNVPFYVQKYRSGHAFGNTQLLDGLAHDGLTDVYNNIAMGLCAEKTVSDLSISREVQDDFAIQSYERLLAAQKANRFAKEIAEVQVDEKKNIIFSSDEEVTKYRKEKMPQLRPAFSKTGTITAGNASKINDAGCAMVLMSEEKMVALGLTPLARVVSYADSEVEPIDFCIAPTKACQFALQRAGMKLNQIEYHEINEAFAATALANMKLLDLDPEYVNVNGGAIALGHPIGFSGGRIMISLMTVLQQNKAKYGMASICNGGGGASAIILENLQ